MKTVLRPPPIRFDAAPVTPVVADVPMSRLAEFRQLMRNAGWPVDLARMCHDRLYAYERMALAHTSASGLLRRAAVTLFADYERLPVGARTH